jgi:predicted RNA-binding protein with PIN domain
MTNTYLIDGYNLLFAVGILAGPVGPHGLEKARGQLLGLLRGVFEEEAAAVTVVFDAAHAVPGLPPEQHIRGLHLIFAQAKQEADDVIESLILHASAPKSVHVVSDDHRIQQAARRKGCQVLGCEEFVAWLDSHRKEKRQQSAAKPEKQQQLSDADIKFWLTEFGDVEHDPALKRAFESFDFEPRIDTD